ncbi:MAG: cysteine desulfurase IscS [Bellilinea sp.]|nr:MAG: cysteine desulfurase IscS [Bellilinea sp.]
MNTFGDRIYLDYAATTPVDSRVVEAMLPYFDHQFGNPSSVHIFGQEAEAALEYARETIARILGVTSDEIVFTSCGTESDNLALRGVAFERKIKYGADRILISPVEHHAVSHTARQMADHFGFRVEFLKVDSFGMVDPDYLRKVIAQDVAIVSVIHGNNEIGSINPVMELGQICRNYQVPFHVDAVQSAAHLSIKGLDEWCDLASFGAHKFYGPKGVGALFIRKGTPILPIQTGGGQEKGIRSGTQNVPYIVGMAKAFELAQTEGLSMQSLLIQLRNRIITSVQNEIEGCRLTGHPTERLANHASFVFDGVDGNQLLVLLDAAGFACSSGSACKTGDPKPSEVLLGIGIPPKLALGSLRVTLGKYTTPEEVEKFVIALPLLINKIRNMSLVVKGL